MNNCLVQTVYIVENSCFIKCAYHLLYLLLVFRSSKPTLDVVVFSQMTFITCMLDFMLTRYKFWLVSMKSSIHDVPWVGILFIFGLFLLRLNTIGVRFRIWRYQFGYFQAFYFAKVSLKKFPFKNKLHSYSLLEYFFKIAITPQQFIQKKIHNIYFIYFFRQLIISFINKYEVAHYKKNLLFDGSPFTI